MGLERLADHVLRAERGTRKADSAGAGAELNHALAGDQLRVRAEVARQYERCRPQAAAGAICLHRAIGLMRHVGVGLLLELDGVREGVVGEARDALGYEERAHRRTHLAGTAGWEGRDGALGAWG